MTLSFASEGFFTRSSSVRAFEVLIVLAGAHRLSFVQYDASADGLRKCLVPNGILYGIQFHVCLSVLWGPLAL